MWAGLFSRIPANSKMIRQQARFGEMGGSEDKFTSSTLPIGKQVSVKWNFSVSDPAAPRRWVTVWACCHLHMWHGCALLQPWELRRAAVVEGVYVAVLRSVKLVPWGGSSCMGEIIIWKSHFSNAAILRAEMSKIHANLSWARTFCTFYFGSSNLVRVPFCPANTICGNRHIYHTVIKDYRPCPRASSVRTGMDSMCA